MFGKGTLGRSRPLAFGFLAALWGCGLLGGDRAAEHPKAVAETVFREPGHSLSACLHEEIARSHLDWPESALFFERDSTIRVTLPTKKGAAHYHLHLIHRVGDQTLDTLVMQDREGSLTLDLSRFDQPEEVVVVSDAKRIVEDGTQVFENPRSDSPRELIPTPAYAVSFRLIPAEGGMETVLSLQRHRWEIKTESGTLYLLTSSPNPRDHLLTFMDPRKSHASLIAEDPYVYVPSQKGVIPPRLAVEVRTHAPENRVWQRAATYHMPEGIESLVKAGEKPFLFRTSKRDLIAFSPAPRVEVALPTEPAATSAHVRVSPSGLFVNESLKLVVACIYPSGPKGDTAAWVRSWEIGDSAKAEAFSVDLGHLDPSLFPLTSALEVRSVLPFKLTGGRYSSVPPSGTSAVPLVPSPGTPTLYSKFLTPIYASHYDFLRFLGAGGGGKKTSPLLEDYLGTSHPDDPNLAPPPPASEGGVTPTPTVPGGILPSGSGGGQGAGGGGPDSACGCGKDGKNCRNVASPCKGTCGQGCPANGCCDPENNLDGGNFLVTFPCPPKGKNCGKDEKDCKCPPHEWDRDTIRAAIMAAIKANPFLSPRFADLDGPNVAVGFGPCHKRSHATDVLAHFWKDAPVGIGAPALQQFHVTYHVDVIFKPCIGGPSKPMGVLWPLEPNTPNLNPGSPQNVAMAVQPPVGPLGPTFTVDFLDPLNPLSTSLNPAIDPNTAIDVALASTTLTGNSKISAVLGLTNVLSASILRADLETLQGIRSALDSRMKATSTNWLLRPTMVLSAPDTWEWSIPSAQWAIYQAPGSVGTSGTTSGTPTPPSTPPPTSPTPPPTTPSKVGPRS